MTAATIAAAALRPYARAEDRVIRDTMRSYVELTGRFLRKESEVWPSEVHTGNEGFGSVRFPNVGVEGRGQRLGLPASCQNARDRFREPSGIRDCSLRDTRRTTAAAA